MFSQVIILATLFILYILSVVVLHTMGSRTGRDQRHSVLPGTDGDRRSDSSASRDTEVDEALS